MGADLLSNIVIGLSTALTVNNLLFCALGVTLGTLIGVIPGIGALSAISMLFPITFYMEPTTALIMLAGIWYGTSYGGSTASILLNLPGTPSSAVTCLDGYPMAQQGRAGVALFMTTVASFVGASMGILLMMLFSGPLVTMALSFRSAEYFSLMVLGLVAASVVSEGSAIKGIAMVITGVLLGLAGTDMYTGVQRFSFNILELADGLSLVALAMGVFGLSEIISSVRSTKTGEIRTDVTMRSMLPTRKDVRLSIMPMLRASSLGSFFGVMPGVGASVASFMSYSIEKRISREPARFGKGAIEGIVAPEAANNAADQTAFIPTMALGIPGSATMALFLGVLMVHGITPGPQTVVERPELFWGLVMSFWVGNVLLVVLNIPLIGVWVRILTIPYHVLYPAIIVFVCIGVYAISNNPFDVFMVIFFGALGYGMRVLHFPAAPLLLGFVLGPMLEENFRRAMILSRGSVEIFFTRPINAFFMTATLLLLAWTIWSAFVGARLKKGLAAP